MKKWKILYVSIVLVIPILGTLKILDLAGFLKSENHKNKIINDYRIKLKNCFDLENKKNRRINDSLKLIEYCVKEFGLD